MSAIMSDTRPDSHKRTKSALALSLLHRDRSKTEDNEDDGSSIPGSDVPSPAESPTSVAPPSHHAFPHIRTSRHKLKGSVNNPAQEKGSSETKIITSTEVASRHTASKSQDVGPTIEQSVRMFRLFEILRSGDSIAIAKAVRETSEMPPIEEDSRGTLAPSSALEGTTLLHLAIQCANPPVVEEILSVARSTPGVTVDVNARDREGNTPLHLASMLGRASTVRLLLDQPDINDSLINYQGRSPLDFARTPEIFQSLQLARSLFMDAKTKEIQGLVNQKNYDELEKFLEDSHVEAVIDVNSGELATDPITVQSGGTLLHEAARNRDFKLIQLLLLHGADPFRRDRKGKLPQDVTKDDRTRAILKKSPAAAAAQRGIQEKAVLGNLTSPTADNSPGGKDGREMKGYLKKWTNYTTGYKLRWFVLEDGVLSYYKHQDDAGSACRGAINMRISKLYMDPQDKTRFEIQGKSSVKYHLKANHIVEAKRWFWALNNAIQWTKDEAKEEEKQKQRNTEMLRLAKTGLRDTESDGSRLGPKGLAPAVPVSAPLSTTPSRVSIQDSLYAPAILAGEDEGSIYGSYEPSFAAHDVPRCIKSAKEPAIPGDRDDEEEFGDDASSHEMQPANKDAFNITAHSASLQLTLLAQVSAALQKESSKEPAVHLNSPSIVQAISTYEAAVRSLQGLVGDLLKISRDRDAYWQYRLDREADVRKLWEDSMARVAKEQEELEGRIGESEIKRKRTKRALRDVLESSTVAQSGSESRSESQAITQGHIQLSDAREIPHIKNEGSVSARQRPGGPGRRRSTLADLADISDSDEDDDEEFFDAIDSGEVDIIDEMPPSTSSPPVAAPEGERQETSLDIREAKRALIMPSFQGYEDPIRERLKMDADDRPKISLWGILKSMIGKDMTKMTLPVSFNEPTSLLQRVAEDMEYTDLLDTAADRTDSTERMVYVAAFAASEYASTIGRVAKPFNPLLGETYEYVRPDKGYRFFIEQVSHHPPIGAAWAESPKWDYYGESAVKSKFYGKSFDINPLGTWFLKLRPASGGEELYTWKKVTSSVIGIITGSPTVDNYGLMEIKNWTTGEVCTLDFKPRGWKASSAYQVNGKVIGVDGKVRWSIGGRWNDKIYARLTPGFEDSVFAPGPLKSQDSGSTQAFLVWEAHARPTGIPFNLTPFVVTFQYLPDRLRPLLPPTDTRFRPDQRAMEDGEYDLAATEKTRVEEKQRATRRIREVKGEEFVSRWFRKGRCEITGEEYWVSTGEYWQVRQNVGNGGKWERVEEIF